MVPLPLMVDLGVYNFIKNALAAGKSKEVIVDGLTRGGMLTPEQIEEAFTAVQQNTPPRPASLAAATATNPASPASADTSFHERVTPAGADPGAITASKVGLVSPTIQMERPQQTPVAGTFGKALALFVWLVVLVVAGYAIWIYVLPLIPQAQGMLHNANAQYEQNLTGGLDK